MSHWTDIMFVVLLKSISTCIHMSGSQSGNKQYSHQEIMNFFNKTIYTDHFLHWYEKLFGGTMPFPQQYFNDQVQKYMRSREWAYRQLEEAGLMNMVAEYEMFIQNQRPLHTHQPSPKQPSQHKQQAQTLPARPGHQHQHHQRNQYALPDTTRVRPSYVVNGEGYYQHPTGRYRTLKYWQHEMGAHDHLETTLDDTATAYDVPLDLTA